MVNKVQNDLITAYFMSLNIISIKLKIIFTVIFDSQKHCLILSPSPQVKGAFDAFSYLQPLLENPCEGNPKQI